MSKKLHFVCCCINSAQATDKRWNYLLMTQYLMASMLKARIDPKDISCIAYDKAHCKKLSKKFGVNTIQGPPIPKAYRKGMSIEKNRKLFFYKPICYKAVFANPPDNDTTVVMMDVDGLFRSDPTDYLLKLETDVWSIHSYRYLRPTRKARLKSKFINPRLDSTEELSGYLGSEAQAYLSIKYGIKELPERRITSNFVAVQPHVFAELITTWKNMSDQIIRMKFCKGDQEILAAAISHLGLSYNSDSAFAAVQDYGGAKRHNLWRDIKELKLQI